MTRRRVALSAALGGIALILAGCSLIGSDTLSRPDVATAQLVAQCKIVLADAAAINTEVTEQFRKLDAGDKPSGEPVRTLVRDLTDPAPAGPLATAVEQLAEQYDAIATQLDTGAPDPAAIEDAGSRVVSASESLAAACS